MAACSLRCLQWEELKEQPESRSRILTTAVICIQVRPAWSPPKKKKKKNICTRGDFHPSLRACLRSAVLISANTPRRKVCFTTFPPPRSRRNEARTTSCEAFDLVWLRGMAECAKLFSTAERREKKKMKRGGEKTEKGSVVGIHWRRSMASRPSVENILMLHRCLYGNSIQ